GELPHHETFLLLAAIGGVERPLVLVQREVIVDHNYGIDAVARRRLEFGSVLEEATIARETHYGSIGKRALGAQRGGETPAERARRAQVHLSGGPKRQILAGPHAGVSSVDDHDGVFGQGG